MAGTWKIIAAAALFLLAVREETAVRPQAETVTVFLMYIRAVEYVSVYTFRKLAEQAIQAFEARNRIRTEARNMMADEETRKLLDKERPNKTFEELIESKMKRKGMTREEAIRDILETATKTNEDVNKELGLGDD